MPCAMSSQLTGWLRSGSGRAATSSRVLREAAERAGPTLIEINEPVIMD